MTDAWLEFLVTWVFPFIVATVLTAQAAILAGQDRTRATAALAWVCIVLAGVILGWLAWRGYSAAAA